MRNFSSQKGFSLPELLVGAAILAFALTGLLLLFINSAVLSTSNRNTVTATIHAQYILEEIRNTANVTQITTKINNGTWDLNATELSASPYNLTTLPSESIDAGIFQSGDPLGVSVEANWTDVGTRSHTIALRTFITDLE